MENVASMLRMKKECKAAIENNGCKFVYNRGLGGYQVISGFTASDVEYPTRVGRDMILSKNQLDRLYSCCDSSH